MRRAPRSTALELCATQHCKAIQRQMLRCKEADFAAPASERRAIAIKVTGVSSAARICGRLHLRALASATSRPRGSRLGTLALESAPNIRCPPQGHIARTTGGDGCHTHGACVVGVAGGDTTTLKLRRQGMSASTSPFTRSKVSSERCSLLSRPECGRRCGPRARVYLGASAGWLWRARAVKVVRAAWVTEAAYWVYLPPSSFTIAR